MYTLVVLLGDGVLFIGEDVELVLDNMEVVALGGFDVVVAFTPLLVTESREVAVTRLVVGRGVAVTRLVVGRGVAVTRLPLLVDVVDVSVVLVVSVEKNVTEELSVRVVTTGLSDAGSPWILATVSTRTITALLNNFIS